MGDRENLEECDEKALSNFMFSMFSRKPVGSMMSLDEFKRKYRSEALRSIALDKNCHLNTSQWEVCWRNMEGRQGVQVVKRSNGNTTYRWIGQQDRRKGERVTEYTVLTKLDETQRNRLAEVLAGIVLDAGRIKKTEAWEKAYQNVGFRVKGRAIGPIVGMTARYLGDGLAVVSDNDHFVIGKSGYAKRKAKTIARHQASEDRQGSLQQPTRGQERTIQVGGVKITLPVDGSIKFDEDVVVEGTTKDGGYMRLKLKGVTITFVSVLVLALIIAVSSGAL